MIIIKLLNHTALLPSHTEYLKELAFSNRVLSETNSFPATGGRDKHKETNTSDEGVFFISSDSILKPLTLVTSCERERGGEREIGKGRGGERGREGGEREGERGRERGRERGGERRGGGGGEGGSERSGWRGLDARKRYLTKIVL